MSPYTKIIYFLMAWATFCILMAGHPEAGDWRSDFNGRNNGSCCGEEDCWVVFARILEDTGGETVTVEITTNGTIMTIPDFPRESLHASQDGQDWACHPYYAELEAEENAGSAISRYDEFGNVWDADFCSKKTTNPDCINCVFINVGT